MGAAGHGATRERGADDRIAARLQRLGCARLVKAGCAGGLGIACLAGGTAPIVFTRARVGIAPGSGAAAAAAGGASDVGLAPLGTACGWRSDLGVTDAGVAS
ncbi:MAG TPA: hypothetical protein VGQ78_10310 [Vicinamibacteria bacterium]|nr:hypothetical protein [Vicinamibacteria bacterium]